MDIAVNHKTERIELDRRTTKASQPPDSLVRIGNKLREYRRLYDSALREADRCIEEAFSVLGRLTQQLKALYAEFESNSPFAKTKSENYSRIKGLLLELEDLLPAEKQPRVTAEAKETFRISGAKIIEILDLFTFLEFKIRSDQFGRNKTISAMNSFALFCILPAALFFFSSYFFAPAPLDLKAIETVSFPLDLAYLDKPMEFTAIVKSFSGDKAKITLCFELNGKKTDSPLTRLTYLLKGEMDYGNVTNQQFKGINYLTVYDNETVLGKKRKIRIDNLLNTCNKGLKSLNNSHLKKNEIASVVLNLTAWYEKNPTGRGDVSASFFQLNRYRASRTPQLETAR